MTATPDDGAALLPCCDCGEPVIEFSIANEDWNALVRRDGPETDKEYLCVRCFGARAAATLRATRSPAPVSGEAAERAASEIMGRFAVHRSERNLKEIAAIIQHCAGAGREGLPATTREP